MEENKREFALDLDKVVHRVYTKIAEWHNEENLSPEEKGLRLRFVSREIVDLVITEAFSQLDGARVRAQIIPTETPKKESSKGGSGGSLFSGFINKKKEE